MDPKSNPIETLAISRAIPSKTDKQAREAVHAGAYPIDEPAKPSRQLSPRRSTRATRSIMTR
jgi:hypothetical protein